MYEYVNMNPCKKRLGDCVVRALSLALNQSWYRTAIDLCIEGLIQCDMQDSNTVFGTDRYITREEFESRITAITAQIKESEENAE